MNKALDATKQKERLAGSLSRITEGARARKILNLNLSQPKILENDPNRSETNASSLAAPRFAQAAREIPKLSKERIDLTIPNSGTNQTCFDKRSNR